MKMKNSIFSLNEFLDILTDEYVRNSRKEEYLYRTLTSTSFYGWLFNPPENAKLNIERDKKELYEVLSSSKVLSNILGTIEDYGYDEFPRTAAVFLYSLCNYVVDECNNDSNDVDLAYRSGAITRSKKDESQAKIEKRFERASKINDLLNKMIKHEAKSVWKRCGLNKTTVIEAFKSVPEQAYLKNSDIGYYLNIVNSQLYDSLDEFYELDEIDIPYFKWITVLLGCLATYFNLTTVSFNNNDYGNIALMFIAGILIPIGIMEFVIQYNPFPKVFI